ncbi:hypothetical protein C0J52_17484 [Blattella germanica]|nr:hypothetical protein C0J52_17484 [Blattella germanica]
MSFMKVVSLSIACLASYIMMASSECTVLPGAENFVAEKDKVTTDKSTSPFDVSGDWLIYPGTPTWGIALTAVLYRDPIPSEECYKEGLEELKKRGLCESVEEDKSIRGSK